jgi:hypothetical protein
VNSSAPESVQTYAILPLPDSRGMACTPDHRSFSPDRGLACGLLAVWRNYEQSQGPFSMELQLRESGFLDAAKELIEVDRSIELDGSVDVDQSSEAVVEDAATDCGPVAA